MIRLRILWGLLLIFCLRAAAHEGPGLRRPISPEQPAWIIHIDVWNYADPQKIIDMVPEDVRPYVIFNIATSSNDNLSASGPAIYDSWMKVCAQNRVWTMIQCASGAANRMPDDGSTQAYEQYFKDYPNFLGFNFAEQFWGFGDEGRVDFPTRLQLFADLLAVCHEYGGYLAVSFCDSYYSSSKMPIAWLKRNEQMRRQLTEDPEHFLCFEKYTLKKNFLDIESNCLGQWLGGFAGQYGIRFDSSGWMGIDNEADDTRGASDFVRAAGAIPVAEHIMLTGQTMMDGPELTWTECSTEGSTTTVDGYTRRNWEWFPQFTNISLDLFRKVLDGTIRIMSRQEVIDRTKVCIVNDINRNLTNENEHNSYVTPEKLFDGLYRSDQDQGGSTNHWLDNRWWLKTTGRYPTIPQVYAAPEGMKAFNKSTFSKTAFDAWMNDNFVSEYTGDIYAGRQENGWVTYNPYQYDESTEGGQRICSLSTKRAEGTIPLQYNTCECLSLDYAPYSLGIIKEYKDFLTLYLTNYQTTGTFSEDIIKVSGVTNEPTVSWKDRGDHVASQVTSSWADGVLTISVKHNGPLDLSVECAGLATDRKTPNTQPPTPSTQHPASNTQHPTTVPAAPPVYEGTLQYEAELADYKSATIRKTGYGQGCDGYQGQGFAELTSRQSALRFVVSTPRAGWYLLTLRYQADADGSVKVNDSETLALTQTSGWASVQTLIHLLEGANSIILQNASGTKVILDCITLENSKAETFTPDSNGEYHVRLADIIASGNVSIDVETGMVTQAADGGQTGSLRLYFDHADFTHVVSLKVTYEGDGDIFRYLLITDGIGTSINPSGTQGAFWSSKYALNYADYQQAEASRAVCKLEWVANAPEGTRTMTIKDILIKTDGTPGAIVSPLNVSMSQSPHLYDLQGRKADTPRRGVYIQRTENGRSITKLIK